MKNAMRAILCTLVIGAGTAAIPAVSNATTIGDSEGCTPGYWKNHTSSWEETDPTVTFGELYTSAPAIVADVTLPKALAGGGGKDLDGASKILARAATAAWLNAAHDGLGYPWRRDSAGLGDRPALVGAVNAAFTSKNRDKMIALASQLDKDNNLGCPLN